MRFLKQSTSVDLPIGPFVDQTDGFTAETALTITQPDVRLKKNAAAWAQKAAVQTLTHEENGYYEVTLDATDTDTLGQLRLAVNESGALPVWEEFMVMPANVWDSLFGADALQIDATAVWAAATRTLTDITDTGLSERLARIQSDVDTGLRVHIDDSDTGVKDVIADLDTGLRDFIDDADTGIVAGVWAVPSRTLTAFSLDTGIAQTVWRESGSTYTDTGSLGYMVDNFAATVDTGVVNQSVWQANAARGITAIADTGMNERFARIQSDVDTGLRAQIGDADTGLHDAIADLDTGLRAILLTTGVNVTQIDSDTGAADQLGKAFTTVPSYFQQVDVQLVDADTGAATHLQQLLANGFNDTGLNERLARIQSDVDTGLRVHIDDSDTGVKDAIADLDTGLRDHIDNTDTGLRARLNAFAEDTGGVNVNSIQGDTGAAGWLRAAFAAGFTDTGLNQRLGQIQSDVDTGLRVHIDDLDTGLHAHITDVDTGVVEKTLQGLANRLWNADMAEITDSGTAARRTPLQAVRALRNRVEMDTGTFTVMKEDDLTVSFTGTLETDTGAKPIKTINPA